MAKILLVSAEPAPAVRAALLESGREVVETADGNEAVALCVIVLAAGVPLAPPAPQLRCPLIVVGMAPALALGDVVDALAACDTLAGVVRGDDLAALRALVARVLGTVAVGSARLLAGSETHTFDVADYADKARCLAAVLAFAERAGVSTDRSHALEQCVEELVMNALYDAPVDREGRRVFAGVPVATRIRERTNATVAVSYACDGRQFALSVRDAFGSLDRGTVVSFLHKSLRAANPVDRKAGGAGLGLFLMLNIASAVAFHVVPGVATEVVCTIDVAPGAGLAQLAFVAQQDAGALRSARPARRLPSRARARRRTAIAAIAAAVAAAGGVVAWIATRPPPSHEPAIVAVDSQPRGADIEVDGHPAGTTPIDLTTLPPGKHVSLVLARRGYQRASLDVDVPGRGKRVEVRSTLVASPDFVRVRFVSDPPGAQIVRTGEPSSPDRTYTPTEIPLEVGKEQRFTLLMPHHAPLVLDPFTLARGQQGVVKGGPLPPAP